MRTTRLLLPAVLAAALAIGGCSGGDDENAEDDVATLGADDASDDSSDEGSEGGGRGARALDPEFQDAMLEFAECMREQGIDFPDPQFSDDGGVMIGGVVNQTEDGEGGGPSLSDREDMEAADEACRHIMEEVEGFMPEIDPEELAEMQDQALEFAECMREHGIDMPDPEFQDGGGRVTVSLGDGTQGNAIDPNDEDFQEAAEECGGEGGFGGPMIGVGGGPADDEDDE